MRILLPHFVELFADFSVEAEPQVVVQCELPVLFPVDGQFPPVQQLTFPLLHKISQQLGSVNLFVCSPAPTQRAGEVITSAEGDDGEWRVVVDPLGNGFYVVHDAADGAVSACYNEEDVGYVLEQFKFSIR